MDWIEREAQRKQVLSFKQKGQGVVEYAGAMVIATVLIGLSIFVVPDQYAGMVSNIIVSTMNYIIGMIPV